MRAVLSVLVCFVLALSSVWAPGRAASQDEVERLWQALAMPEVLGIMREEGLAYGRSLDADVLEGTGGARFAAQIGRIYDPERMMLAARSAFSGAFDGKDIRAALDFFEGEVGAKAVAAEVEARRAMLDPAVDQEARDSARALQRRDPQRYALMQRFAEANDLIDANVAGALNSNYAFFQGMATSGALPPEMDEAAIVEEVWSQEEVLRDDTRSWVGGFLALSYQRLTLDELTAYVEFSESEAGQVVNRTLFSAFDVMFNGIARQIGAAVGISLVGEEL